MLAYSFYRWSNATAKPPIPDGRRSGEGAVLKASSAPDGIPSNQKGEPPTTLNSHHPTAGEAFRIAPEGSAGSSKGAVLEASPIFLNSTHQHNPQKLHRTVGEAFRVAPNATQQVARASLPDGRRSGEGAVLKASSAPDGIPSDHQGATPSHHPAAGEAFRIVPEGSVVQIEIVALKEESVEAEFKFVAADDPARRECRARVRGKIKRNAERVVGINFEDALFSLWIPIEAPGPQVKIVEKLEKPILLRCAN